MIATSSTVTVPQIVELRVSVKW